MKDLTLSVVAVIGLALAMGLAFHWVYPQVELSSELAGLFVFVALVIKLLLGRLSTLLRKTPQAAEVPK